MPSAFTQNFYHTVFSTRHRAMLITPELEERLDPFMGGIVRDLRCTLLEASRGLKPLATHVRPPGGDTRPTHPVAVAVPCAPRVATSSRFGDTDAVLQADSIRYEPRP